MKVFLYFVGKPKDAHANALASDYIRRANRFAPSQMTEIRPDRIDLWSKHPGAKKVLLDPAGRILDSSAFADLFAKAEMSGHDLVFVIGGHDGLPSAWRERADLLVSLSAMTMPHELARAVLAEQVYRAFTMLRGHPYPR
ncbi:MAG TPA: 23S rRNA (pseudouridine(1915)-N(3))-methyltransferase RlmH [Bryobacteraceae bacterium]|nr:23S rRNA (pseudouridine(1915)-N(3))-methyltransferase RlmH [Bryobacteraceae bacterium]